MARDDDLRPVKCAMFVTGREQHHSSMHIIQTIFTVTEKVFSYCFVVINYLPTESSLLKINCQYIEHNEEYKVQLQFAARVICSLCFIGKQTN